MNKKLVDGIVVSSAALLLTGITALAVKNTKLAFVGGLLGGIGGAIALQQKSKQAAPKNAIARLQQQIEQLQLQHHLVSDRILAAVSEHDMLLATEHDEFIHEEPTIQDIESAIAWFASRNIAIEEHDFLELESDAVINHLALHLGKYYHHLLPIYRQLKTKAISGEELKWNLRNKPEKDVSHITNFCALLHQNSFFSTYNYSKTTKNLKATIQKRGEIRNFFTGLWFERFIYQVVSQTIANQGLNFACLVNPHIQFTDENKFELDLFFLIEGEPLWIECKTGRDYNVHLPKYSQLRDKLQIPKERAFLVVLGISEERAANLTNFWGMTVVNQDKFLQHITTELSRQMLMHTLKCSV